MSFFSDSPAVVFQGGRNNNGNKGEEDRSNSFRKFTNEWLPSDDFFQTKDNDVSSITSSSLTEMQHRPCTTPLIPQKNASGKTVSPSLLLLTIS
jgi:hypothetical protein